MSGNSRGGGTRKKAKPLKLLTKVRWGAEQDGLEAKLLSHLNIRRVVVDERDLRGVQPMLPHEETEDLWVGLDKANSAGDDDAPEPLQKREEIGMASNSSARQLERA